MGYRLCVTGRVAAHSLMKHARLEARDPLRGSSQANRLPYAA
jgi:hypothetical protein